MYIDDLDKLPLSSNFNAELSQRAIAHIEANPLTFDQNSWGKETECGTAHCWYGWCLALSGYNKISTFQDNEQLRDLAPIVVGLEWHDPNFERLSDPDNTLEDLKYYHAKLAAGESIVFDRNGYDRSGYDRDGFNDDGFNRDGYDSDGYDLAGYDSNEYNCDGYDSDGYDCDGLNDEGYDYQGYDSDGFDIDGYNSDGYDNEGYDFHGYDSDGSDPEGFDISGYDVDGYDSDGLDVDGYDRNGCTKHEQLVTQL